MFNDKITIQQRAPGVTTGTLHQQKPEWVNLGVFWADVRHMGGLETLRANSEVSVLRASMRMWYRPEIEASMQVVHNGVIYGISSPPLRNADRRFMDLVCEAVK